VTTPIRDHRCPLPPARAHVSFELIPLKNLEIQLPLLPSGAKVSVTCSPTKGVDATLDVAARLQGAGLAATPHVAARMVRDRAHLAELIAVSRAAGVAEWFVVAGDAPEPAGRYDGGLPLLRDLFELTHGLTSVGVPAYPDGHTFIDGATVGRALHDKQAVLADAGLRGWVSTQLCFDPTVIRTWLQAERAAGLTLPVRLGLSGPVDRTKLLTLGMRVGVGQSLRYLKKNRRGLAGLLRSDGYDPDDLLDALDGDLAPLGICGIHLFTFNQLGAAVEWQRSLAA
jgi:methylenetetrahydrofolate reductase (NADPH)